MNLPDVQQQAKLAWPVRRKDTRSQKLYKPNCQGHYVHVFELNCVTTIPIHSVYSCTSVTAKFNNVPIKLSVDSQCQKTIIPKSLYTGKMGKLTNTDIKFKPYGTNYRLKTLGVFNTTITAASGAGGHYKNTNI